MYPLGRISDCVTYLSQKQAGRIQRKWYYCCTVRTRFGENASRSSHGRTAFILCLHSYRCRENQLQDSTFVRGLRKVAVIVVVWVWLKTRTKDSETCAGSQIGCGCIFIADGGYESSLFIYTLLSRISYHPPSLPPHEFVLKPTQLYCKHKPPLPYLSSY